MKEYNVWAFFSFFGEIQSRKTAVCKVRGISVYCTGGSSEEGATLYLRPSQLLFRMGPKESFVGTDSLENRKMAPKKDTSISGQIR